MRDRPGSSEAVRSLFLEPKFEVLPFRSVFDQVEFLPRAATVTVTASPSKGMQPTLEYSTKLAERGFEVVPHIAARSFADRGKLANMLDTFAAAGIGHLFVIGGDSTEPGEFPDGLALIRAIDDLGHRSFEIGIPAYPDGHAFISNETLRQDLKDKQPHASYMTTQMCFDPDVISRWVAAVRTDGITLPIHLGMPGVAPVRKLIGISAQIGVKTSARFLARNRSLLGWLLRRGMYSPDRLVQRLGDVIADPAAKIEKVHVYTFNQVEPFEAWRQDWLTALER